MLLSLLPVFKIPLSVLFYSSKKIHGFLLKEQGKLAFSWVQVVDKCFLKMPLKFKVMMETHHLNCVVF